MIGKNGDYRHEDYHFQRQESPARKALPFEDEGELPHKTILAALCILFFIAVIMVVT